MPNLSEGQSQLVYAMLNTNHAEQHNPQVHATNSTSGLFTPSTSLDRWIIDSGATNHVTSCPHSLTSNTNNSTMPLVVLPSGEKTPMSATGTISLDSYLYLRDVFSVPTFHVNLMSISKLTKGLNCSMTFFPSQHFIGPGYEDDDWSRKAARRTLLPCGIGFR